MMRKAVFHEKCMEFVQERKKRRKEDFCYLNRLKNKYNCITMDIMYFMKE